MRLIVVGSARERNGLRGQLESAAVDVVAEFDTLAEARAVSVAADGILLASSPTRQSDDERPFLEPLTSREIEVLELVAEGLANKAIAARLGISDQTVKFHVASISNKLGASNRTDAVRRAVRTGLITL
jgi:DNA-binding NarL/FixJ family response regulator